MRGSSPATTFGFRFRTEDSMTDHRIQTWDIRRPAVVSDHGIVASQSLDAARAGASILAAGGNAMGAAVATRLALAATEPWMRGLGGGGSMLVHSTAAARTPVLGRAEWREKRCKSV